VKLTTRAPVEAIRKVDGGFEVRTADGTALYDRVIVTAAGPLAARMCPDLAGEERARLENLRYHGVVCASLLLKSPLRQRYLTYIADETIPFTGVIEMTAVVNPADFGGRTLVYLPTYVPADDPLFEAPDETIRTRCIATLSKMYEGFSEDQLLAFKVSRARNVLAIQGLDYSRKVPPMSTSVPGLFIVTSAQIINGNLNVDETIALAKRAVGPLLDADARLAGGTDRAAANQRAETV
jgi:protoporphyrinogen oxidase